MPAYLIISGIFALIAVIILLKAREYYQEGKILDNTKQEELNKIDKEIQVAQSTLTSLQEQDKHVRKEISQAYEEKYQAQREVNSLQGQQNEVLKKIQQLKDEFNQSYINNKSEIEKKTQDFKDAAAVARSVYIASIEEAYTKEEEIYQLAKQDRQDEQNKMLKEFENQRNHAEAELKKTQSSLNAATEAQLREREKAEKIDFYRLTLDSNDLEDVQRLNVVKQALYQPVILSKLIWSTYFQKQTTEMCNRVLGANKVCGIYKITNIQTQQCYIGQSVDIAQRWKDHAKCGLGIEAPATNKLYKAMQQYGLYNFTFELLETCSREQLDEKEAFWIEMYQSNKLGYNSTKGNKT